MAADPEKISQLTEATVLADADEAVVVDKSDTTHGVSGTTKRTLLSTLRSWLGKDEDDMVSDSDTHFPTQQSVKAYVTTETSQLLPLDGSEDMTGGLTVNAAGSVDISVESVTPVVDLTETDGTTDAKRARIRLAGDQLRIQRLDDNGGGAVSPIKIELSTGQVNMLEAPSIFIPDGTAAGHAVNKGQLDAATSQLLPLDGSRDMTGDVTIEKQAPRTVYKPTSTAASGVDFLAQNGNRQFRLAHENAGSVLAVYVYDAATDAFVATALSVDAAGNLSVPAVAGANQAAQVTAYDATTGQLQIAGVEQGDTGDRNIAASTLPVFFTHTRAPSVRTVST